MTKSILPILEKLISFKSVTPKGVDAIEYIANFLSNLGFECEIKFFGEDTKRTCNLYAILGNASPNICFAGHVDVVPAMNENSWLSDPFKINIQDNLVYGRGAVDMKGSIACALAAVAEFLQHNKKPKTSISFLLTTDEEGDAEYGTIQMLEHIKNHTPKIDFCILGEPTTKTIIGDTIKIGRRGSINFTLKISGKQGHVAYPEKACNPMPTMVNILKNLTNQEFDQGSKYFQKSNLEITSIDTGNTTNNVIVESVIAKFNIRFNDHHTADALNSKVTAIILKHTKTNNMINYDLQYSCASKPFIQKYSPTMQQFAQIVKDVCKITPDIETGGGTSDARFIQKYAEIVEFGLNCNSAHKINEHTKISDLQSLYNVYYDCLSKLYKS